MSAVEESRLRVTILLTSHLLLLTSCDATLPPLRGKMEAGRDPYAVFVGGGKLDADLYAVRPEGGPPVQITFTNVAEQKPALAPDGLGLAFLRGRSLDDPAPTSVWLMNLANGGERELVLPTGAEPRRVGWARDGETLIIATTKGLYRFDAPFADSMAVRVQPPERAWAESSLAVLLGDPVFTRVVPCEKRRDLCVVGARGRPALLAGGVSDPVRWGGDSVGFFVGDRLQIRPLRRGRPRILLMTNAPERPREMTFFSGTRDQLSP